MPNSDSSQKQTILPDVGDIIFVLIVQFLLYLRPTFLFGDGSTGWHLVTGQYILDTHSIPHHDLISYTFPQKAWVAYQWLSDVVMAWLTKLGGLNLLAVVMSSLIGLLFLLLYERCRKEGANFAFALAITICGALISAVHWLARPVIFTFFGVYIFSTKLEDYYNGKISGRQLLLPLFLFIAIWVNSHPTFLFGLFFISIYLFSAVLNATRSKFENNSIDFSKIKTLSITLLVCSATTLFNPYGIELYNYITNYLRGSSVIAATDEFASPIFHGALQPTCLELLFLLLVVGLAFSRKRISLPRFLCCLAFGHLALSALRNTPLFVIVALPAISQLYSSFPPLPGSGGPQWFLAIKYKWRALVEGFSANEARCQLHLLPILYTAVLVLAALNGGQLFNYQLVNSGFDQKTMPTSTLEYIRIHNLAPTAGFNYDNWGGYIKYKLGIPVFIDDRADFYGEPFYVDYGSVSQVNPGWNDVLTKHHIQWLLFPKNSRIVATLRENSAWTVASQDDGSVLLVRK